MRNQREKNITNPLGARAVSLKYPFGNKKLYKNNT
jgi:hypothetical protein